MAQHFLLSRQAKTLSLAHVLQMSDVEAEVTFRKVRWAETDGEPVCPHCGGLDAYECRRPNGALRFRCRACAKDFTITSGTLFHSHKMALRMYLAAIAIFVNEVKGKNALAMSRDLGLAYKSAFVLCHKLREAMASDRVPAQVAGDVEIDGGYFGGYVKPTNYKENRRDRRLARNQSGKREVVVIVRERKGRSVPFVFKSETAAVPTIRKIVAPGSIIHADEASAWDQLHARYAMKRINHQRAYSDDGACTNWAESWFSRMRRAEIGHHHHVAGRYLASYANEMSWREDNRRVSNGEQFTMIAQTAIRLPKSDVWCGYWHRAQ